MQVIDPQAPSTVTHDAAPALCDKPAAQPKKLGIRYRSPYETRHTYATMLLMTGVTPAFAARQMGHSIQMFLTTYARWIDGGQNALEMGKLKNLIAPPTPPAKASGTP